MTDSSAASSPTERSIPVTPEIVALVRDAVYLLEYAIATGFKTKENLTIPEDVITRIKTAAALVGAHDAQSPPSDPSDSHASTTNKSVMVADCVSFQVAYHQLATLLSPITAETLRATDDPSDRTHPRPLGASIPQRRSRILSFLAVDASQAVRFTRLIWFYTIVFAGIVIFGDWWGLMFGPAQEGQVDWQNNVLQLLNAFTPYAYGGLGSCLYLLRSAHFSIYTRCFDLHRKSEYMNRILLGTVSGGAIILLISQVAGDGGRVIQLSSAALGFIAGYSTDFLFNAIERIVFLKAVVRI